MPVTPEKGVLGRTATRIFEGAKQAFRDHAPEEEAAVRRILSGEITAEDLTRHRAEIVALISQLCSSTARSSFLCELMPPLPLSVGKLIRQEEERFARLSREEQKNEVRAAAKQKAERWGLT